MNLCLICKKEFKDNSPTKNKKFCSNKCKQKNFWESEKGKSYLNKNRKKRVNHSKEYYKNNRDKVLESCHNYYLKNRFKLVLKRKGIYKINKIIEKKRSIIWKKNNPNKTKVHNLFTKHKKQNPHLYPKICILCGSTKNIDFHHPNYDFPYSVYPLCRSHHLQIHRN